MASFPCAGDYRTKQFNQASKRPLQSAHFHHKGKPEKYVQSWGNHFHFRKQVAQFSMHENTEITTLLFIYKCRLYDFAHNKKYHFWSIPTEILQTTRLGMRGIGKANTKMCNRIKAPMPNCVIECA